MSSNKNVSKVFKKFTDKRVDKICLEKGLIDYEIFYSPIKAWIDSLLLSVFILFIFFIFVSSFLSYLLLYVLSFSYLIISFLVFSKNCHSFVLTNSHIIVINPNFLFRKYEEFKIDEIKKIEINSSKKFIFEFFLIFNQNYVAIETESEYKKFYCAGLDVTSYDDENDLTEKTLDHLNSSLQKKGIETKLYI